MRAWVCIFIRLYIKGGFFFGDTLVDYFFLFAFFFSINSIDSLAENKKCAICSFLNFRNVKCGSLQCKDGDRQPNQINGVDIMNSKTIISIKGIEYECKWVCLLFFQTRFFSLLFIQRISTFFSSFNRRTSSGPAITRDYTEDGLVRDGTPCGKNLVCVNQTCVSIFPYIDQTKCPTNGNNVECYGQGVSQIDFNFILSNGEQRQQKKTIYWCVCCLNLPVSPFFMCIRCAQIRTVAFVISVMLDPIVPLLCR